jgi:hypothetical protein
LRSSVRADNAKRQDLPENQNNPELLRLDIPKQRPPAEPSLTMMVGRVIASNCPLSIVQSILI